MFQMQWKLLWQKKTTWFVLLVNTALAIYFFTCEVRNPGWEDVSGFWHYCGMGDVWEWSSFYMVLSFLVAVPAMSFQNDVSSKCLAAIWVRENRTVYFKAKIKAVFCVTFLVTFLPFLLNFLLCLFYFKHVPTYMPSPYGAQMNLDKMFNNGVKDHAWGVWIPLPDFFKAFPILYVFVFLLFMCLFVGFLSIMLMALSFWLRRFKIILFLPVIGMVKLGSLLSGWSYMKMSGAHKYVNFEIWDYVSPFSYFGKVYVGFFVFLALLAGFIFISYRMICKKEYLHV